MTKAVGQSPGGGKSPEDQIRFKDNVSKFTPVDFFSGSPEIKIELWKLEINGFGLPITLEYDINGVKVDNISSMVGLGWNLNVGGSVTRAIKDFPDDKFVNRSVPVPLGGVTGKKVGFMKGGANRLSNFSMNHSSTWRNSYELVLTMGTGFHFDENRNPIKICPDNDGIRYNFYDTQPDRFGINMSGIGQGFMFNKYNQVKFNSQSNLSVSHTIDDGIMNPDDFTYRHNTKGITTFSVIDENGNKYIFSDQVICYFYVGSDRWDISFPGSGNGTPSGNRASKLQYIATTEWKLSKIITRSGDEINFNYEEYEVVYASASFKSKTDIKFKTNSFSKIVKKEKRLTAIETSNQRIRFVAGESRLDLVNSKTLAAIEIYKKFNGNSSLIKTFSFEYNYFQSNVSEPLAHPLSAMLQDDFYKRLKLLGFVEKGSGLDEKKHAFKYNEVYQLPNRVSSKVDFWGFFNNSSNVGLDGLFPTIMVYPGLRSPDKISVFDFDADNSGSPYSFNKGYRFPSSDGNIAGAFGLKAISYPTGGLHEFEFEPHTYFYKNKNFYGGGLRLRKERIYDSVSNRDLTKIYEYNDFDNPEKSSGKIINYPLFAYTENTAGYVTQIDGPPGGQVDPYAFVPTQNSNYYKYFISRTTEPEWALGDFEKNSVEYKHIKEYVVFNGSDNGYNKYTFRAFDFKEMMENNYIYFPQPIPWLTTYTLWPGQGQDPTPCTSTPSQALHSFDQEFDSYADVRGLEFDKGSIPTAPYSGYSWNRGQLLNKQTYNKDNGLLKEEIYQYEDFKPFELSDLVEGMEIRCFENYKIGKSQLLHPAYYGNDNLYFNEFTVYTPYKYYTSNKSVLGGKEVRTYHGPVNYVSDITSYEYNAKAQIKTETIQQSEGGCSRSAYLYPSDFTINSNTTDAKAKSIYDLQQKNQIGEPVEKVIYASCSDTVKAVAAQLNLYTTHYSSENIIVPRETWELDINTPSTFSPLKYNGNTLFWDSKYKKHKEFLYDSKFRLIQQQEESQVNMAFIWGYDNNHIVAKVVGAVKSDIAYTSFEDNNMQGWAVSTPLLIPGYALTGKNNYSLGNGNVYSTIPLNPSATYILSFWQYNGTVPTVNGEIKSTTFPDRLVNQWMYVEKEITGVIQVVIQSEDAGSGQIDELRLYPKGTQMTTYAFDPLVGMTSQCNERNVVTYYEYDDFQRLARIRDMDRNILKQFEYKFKVQYAGATVYVKSRRENFTYVGDNQNGDLVLRFYSDAACTLPVTVNNLTVNLQEMYWDEYSNTILSTTDFSAVCSGSVYKVKSQTLMSIWFWSTETSREWYYIIQPGAGYISGGSSQL